MAHICQKFSFGTKAGFGGLLGLGQLGIGAFQQRRISADGFLLCAIPADVSDDHRVLLALAHQNLAKAKGDRERCAIGPTSLGLLTQFTGRQVLGKQILGRQILVRQILGRQGVEFAR